MSRGYRYLTINMFMGCLLIGGWSGTAQAISFISGDGTGCGAGPNSECVQVNPKTTIQPGHPSTAPEVTIFDGHGGPTAFTHQNVDQWYNPANPNPFDPGGASLNASTGLTGYWVSYTDSGVDADPSQTNPPNFESPYPNHNPNPPAVPNYCGTKGGGFTGVGGNVNPTGTPTCTGFDPKQMQNIPPPDQNRVKDNQTALFTEKVTLPAGTYDMIWDVWTDDTSIAELVGPGGTSVSMNPSNPFPANDGTAVHCANGNIACQQGAGMRFTASGLSGGTYLLNLYAFQVGSDVFGALWGGVFTPGEETFPGNVGEVPEPASLVLLGSGLAGLGLFRYRQKRS